MNDTEGVALMHRRCREVPWLRVQMRRVCWQHQICECLEGGKTASALSCGSHGALQEASLAWPLLAGMMTVSHSLIPLTASTSNNLHLVVV